MAAKTLNRRILWVDSLRGIAALMVALLHLWLHLRFLYPTVFAQPVFKTAGLFISDFIDIGKIGIVVFFMISGYVIPFSLIGKTLSGFAISRFFRLYPGYWFSILLVVLISGMPPLKQLLLNITMFHKFLGVPDLIGVYWTLQIELVFYLICAALFYLNRLDKIRIITKLFFLVLGMALVLSVARFTLNMKLPVALPLALACMFLGMRFRYNETAEDGTLRIVLKYVYIFILVLLPVCVFAYNRDFGYNEKWYKYFVSYNIGFFLFIFFLKKNIHNSFFKFLGNISYSLYLIHPVVGLELTDKLMNKYPEFNNPGAYALLFLILTAIGSIISFFFIEQSILKLSKTLFVGKKEKSTINTPVVG